MPAAKTRKLFVLAALAATVAMTGCVSVPQAKRPADINEYAAAVVWKRDDFKKRMEFSSFDEGANTPDTLFMRAYKFDDPKVPSIYQIYVADYYVDEWRFYTSANDINGNRMDFVQIARDVGSCGSYTGCSKTEHLALNVTREYLEAHVASGIKFQVSGRAGSEVFSIPGVAIAGFLKVIPK